MNTSGANGEPTLLTIIQNTYGGTISTGTIDDTLTLSNGIQLVRVQDTGLNAGGTTLGLGDGDPTLNNDSLWHDGTANFTAEAKYASFKQSFGYRVTAGTETAVFTDNNGSGTSGPFLVGPGGFTWWRAGTEATTSLLEWYSNPAANTGDDHMITFEVLDSGGNALHGNRTWLLAWEDKPFASADKDYNDFVVEVVAVPVPAAGLMGLVTLGGAAAVSALRRRKATIA
ncbi:MAG: DUF4114 domain-containing protein [Planctomycetota bacterium]|nr:DUF4114 domain-containing protein [Planctomycetota bacterium]